MGINEAGGNHGATGQGGRPTASGCGRASPDAHEPTDGRVALVSGGNRGLGLQIVRLLAERGMRVVMGSRSLDRGRVVIDVLGDLADRVVVRQLDITSAASVDGLVSWLRQRLGRCDVLVNNAAVLLDDDTWAAAVDLEVVRSTLETNLLGTWRVTQAVLPLMRAGRYGRIVNVSSDLDGGAATRRAASAYHISKGGVNALTRMLGEDLAEDGILINACSPDPARVGVRDTEGWLWLSAAADVPVWLATLPADGPTGGFFRERATLGR